MLNKEICKICINENSNYNWTENDEENWIRKNIWCVKIGVKNIKGNPPKECKYYTEHIVSE